jgi:hypothetical protein
MFTRKSYGGLTTSGLLEQLCDSLEKQLGGCLVMEDVVTWAESLHLDGRPFRLKGHEYQRDLLKEGAVRQVFLKGAQVGVTSIQMIRTLFGLISGRYPQGVLYLFPSLTDVQDFSRGRFNPLISDNEAVSRHVQDTDTMGIKRIGGSMLYMRGARSTSRVGGFKRSSAALKSVPVDRLVFDERDEMADDMVDLARERVSHSDVKEEVHLSTPTIPSYGVDKLFQESDQRHWFIRCERCGGDTCLELEFPACLDELPDGRVIRLCQRCRNCEISPQDGHWRPLYPDRGKDMVGWRISQLNSVYVDPGDILRLYRDPPNGNLTEVMNSKLAQAHIAAENRLTAAEVLGLCGDGAMSEEDGGPCFLGADIGSLIHCVIGKKHSEKGAEIRYIGAFPDWSHLDSLMRRFGVSRAVIDALPETRHSREFARRHGGKVFCCFYSEHQKGAYGWNEREFTVTANRTESMDASHNEITNGRVLLPKESDTLHEFARHCSNVARVLHTDPDTGASRYIYIKTGPDHYRHAFNYMVIAAQSGDELLFPQFR